MNQAPKPPGMAASFLSIMPFHPPPFGRWGGKERTVAFGAARQRAILHHRHFRVAPAHADVVIRAFEERQAEHENDVKAGPGPLGLGVGRKKSFLLDSVPQTASYLGRPETHTVPTLNVPPGKSQCCACTGCQTKPRKCAKARVVGMNCGADQGRM
jgi:hypothetical protein